MTGNASYRLHNTSVLSVCAVEAPIVVTSAEFDQRLQRTYARNGMKPGMVEQLAGVRERRWWPEDVSFVDAAAMAGAKAMAEAGVDPSQIGLLIDTSVCRSGLEPATAVGVHDQLGLTTACLNFDVTNACLGFLNGIQIAGMMIDSGQVEYALLVDAEGLRGLQEATLQRLERDDATAADVRSQFATLTLGSGSAAMVLGRASDHPEGHRVTGGVSRAGTEHRDLCIGDLTLMRTNNRRLFTAGIELARQTWQDALADGFDWAGADWFVAHQTSVAHLQAMAKSVGVSVDKFPMTVPTYGNLAPAAVPFTLAKQVPLLRPDQRVMLLGIGSGLNTSFAEIIW
jgi:3-oxoacyl-[acyl-carrier-protein] synthase III